MPLLDGQILYNNSDALGKPLTPSIAEAILSPTNTWVFNWPNYILWGVLSLIFVIQAYRTGKLGFAALLFWSMTTAFWQEFYADWAAYLVYSPSFDLIPWDSAYTSPNKPWFVLPAYGNYFLPIDALMVWTAANIRKFVPSMPIFISALIVATPLFYAFNFFIEGTAVANGWWAYLESPGPKYHMQNGTNYPLVFPVIPFVIYGAIACTVLSLKAPTGVLRIENFAWLQTMPSGVKKEALRLLVWCVMMNLVYWFGFTFPLMLLRITGIV